MASTQQWCDRTGENFDDWWKSDNTEIHHFIGKDITYFHTLFWPGMLKSAGFSLPTKVHIHGFLTVTKKRCRRAKGLSSKHPSTQTSRPTLLRYFYASKLNPRIDNIDLSWEEYAAKVDADLVGKIVNIASRCAKFVKAIGLSDEYPDDGGLFEAAATEGDSIAECMKIVTTIRQFARSWNFLTKPINLLKTPNRGT